MSLPASAQFETMPEIIGPDHSQLIAVSLVEVDQRGRLHIPVRIADRVSWLKAKSAPTTALAVSDESGRVSLLNWENEGLQVLKRCEELNGMIAINEAPIDDLVALITRYRLLSIPKDLRPTLGNEILLNLGLPIGATSRLYVVGGPDRIILLTHSLLVDLWKTTTSVFAGLP